MSKINKLRAIFTDSIFFPKPTMTNTKLGIPPPDGYKAFEYFSFGGGGLVPKGDLLDN
jgi:hypothetical protein